MISFSYQNVNFLLTSELCCVYNKHFIAQVWSYILLYFLIMLRSFTIGKCNHFPFVVFTDVFVIYLLSLPCFILADFLTTLTFTWFLKVLSSSVVMAPWVWIGTCTDVYTLCASYQLWLQKRFFPVTLPAMVVSHNPPCRTGWRKPWSPPGCCSQWCCLTRMRAAGSVPWVFICKFRDSRRFASSPVL